MRLMQRRWGSWLAMVATVLLAACPNTQNIRDAISAINREFQKQYEETLTKNGAHIVPQGRGDAFDAVNAALVKLGFVVREQSRDLGVISAEAPAPAPLTTSEFDRCAAVDLPRTREIIRKYLGIWAETFNFDTNGLDTVMTATIVGAPGGSEISFTMRLREVGPPKTDYPRRDYPPPNVLICGLDKTWDAVNRELAALPKQR
jgi:hypothetical protein